MATAQRLELKQSQTLVMTQQMQQSLKLLQLSAVELSQFIEEELEKNPLLQEESGEAAESASESQDDNNAVAVEEGEEQPQQTTDAADYAAEENFPSKEEEVLDVSYENTWDERENDTNYLEGSSNIYNDTKATRNFDNEEYSIEQRAELEESLRDHILDQVYVDINDPAERIIALHLVDLLDDAGYITADLAPIAERLQCEVGQVEQVLRKLQKCDPAGVFARNLAECLALQLKDNNHLDPAMEKLLHHLDLMAQGEFSKLQKICGVDEEDLHDMCEEIKALNPKPGSNFNNEIVQTLLPDVFIRRKADTQGWRVELNNEVLPRLLVDKTYYADVRKRAHDENEKQYLSDQLNTANWLLKALNQRAETMLKVATELVSQQSGFFENGIHHLKPMTLKDIAEAIEMHESTVGRVVANKYISTPNGVYEIKFFFSSSVHNTSGEEDVSSTSVKHLIKKFVDEESPKKILSDNKIVELLSAEGVSVARRTVAKYREALHIPSSSERRRQKRLQVAS